MWCNPIFIFVCTIPFQGERAPQTYLKLQLHIEIGNVCLINLTARRLLLFSVIRPSMSTEGRFGRVIRVK